MVFPRMRAAVAGLLFLAWIGYLLSLVVETRGRILVSAPQLRSADSVVVATLTDESGVPGSAIVVKQVLFPPDVQLAPNLFIPNLALISAKTGWQGPGDYVVPLSGMEPGVTLVPMSPGYFSRLSEVKLELGDNPDGVFRSLSELTGVPPVRFRAMTNGTTLSLMNFPLTSHPINDEEKAALEKWLQSLKTDGAQLITFRPGEAKIYRATPEVIANVEAILR